jgi:hypothetical protein
MTYLLSPLEDTAYALIGFPIKVVSDSPFWRLLERVLVHETLPFSVGGSRTAAQAKGTTHTGQ